MKRLRIVLLLAVSTLIAVAPIQAQTQDTCPHEATIAALHECVLHMEEHGFITNAGIARALHAKLDAAEAALDRNQAGVAINILEAVIHQLGAERGKHIVAEHADHLRVHTEMVIDALTPS